MVADREGLGRCPTRKEFAVLVLSRKPGQRIEIAGSITCTILGVSGGRVRIGVDAPKAMPVVREELLPEWRDRPTRKEKCHVRDR
jgi:carbon storage regulator